MQILMQILRTLFQHWRLVLVLTVVTLALIFLGLTLTAAPRLVSTDPADKAKTTFDHPLTIAFSQDLSSDTASTFSIYPPVKGKTSIEGKSFRFEPTEAYSIGATYEVKVTPVGTNSRRGQQVTFSFVPNEVTRQPSVPLLTAVLPYKHAHYQIEYTTNPDNSLNVHVGLSPTVSPNQTTQYQAQLRQYRDEAFAFIKQNGGDLDKLNLYVYPDPEVQSDENVTGSLQ